jgi:hypothetical protein
MENAPHIVISGRNLPSDIQERFLKWQDEVYSPLYIKNAGFSGIDRYQMIKKSLLYPGSITIYHGKNRKTIEENKKNPTRIDLQKDIDTTFYRVEWVWHDAYVLTNSFRNDASSREATIVENAPVIHLEGYGAPTAEQQRYDQWFMRWASPVYIPILMKSPGLKAYNCFKLSDFSIRWPDRKYLEAEIPLYISIQYFENMEAFQSYSESLEYAAFKRNMELEFLGTLSTIWNVEYQLVKSLRK